MCGVGGSTLIQFFHIFSYMIKYHRKVFNKNVSFNFTIEYTTLLMTKGLCYVSRTWARAKHSPCKSVKTFKMTNSLMQKNLKKEEASVKRLES